MARSYFASEIKALLAHPALPRDLDPLAIQQYFALRYIPSPRSIYQSVRKLPPAHRLIVRGDKLNTEKYWDFDIPNSTPKFQTPHQR